MRANKPHTSCSAAFKQKWLENSVSSISLVTRTWIYHRMVITSQSTSVHLRQTILIYTRIRGISIGKSVSSFPSLRMASLSDGSLFASERTEQQTLRKVITLAISSESQSKTSFITSMNLHCETFVKALWRFALVLHSGSGTGLSVPFLKVQSKTSPSIHS